jgi:hypothetical protein
VGQAQPARDAGRQVRVGRRVDREPPPRSEVGHRSDEPHPVGHLAAELNAALRPITLGVHATDVRPRVLERATTELRIRPAILGRGRRSGAILTAWPHVTLTDYPIAVIMSVWICVWVRAVL